MVAKLRKTLIGAGGALAACVLALSTTIQLDEQAKASMSSGERGHCAAPLLNSREPTAVLGVQLYPLKPL